MLKIVNFLRGHVEVEIEGAFPERFLNVCSQNGIAFWGLNRLRPDLLSAKMDILSYRRAKEYAGRVMCELREARRGGVPSFLSRFRKRYALIAGLLLCFGGIGLSSLFIWDMEVTGNETVSSGEILRELKELGVGVGTYAPSVQPERLKSLMLLRIEKLAWLTVNVRGSHATVSVREREMPPEVVPEDVPCNIVAKKSGMIMRMDVREGARQVENGAVVTKGELLVSGVMDSQIVGARFLHAMADVYAHTWYDLEGALPMNVTVKERTGEIKIRRAVIIAGNRINLYFSGRNPYDSYDKITVNKRLSLPGLVLPIEVIIEEYREYKEAPGRLSEKETSEAMENMLRARLRAASDGAETEREEYGYEISGGVMRARLSAECVEAISKTELIPNANEGADNK